MTQYSAFGVNGNGATGPGTSTSYSGPFLGGMMFQVTSPGQYLDGYYLWRSDSGQSATASFALWVMSSATAGTYQAGTSASASGMSTGAWNYTALGTQFALATGNVYMVVYGFSNNFNDTGGQFGTGDPYVGGITNGPLSVYSAPASHGGTNPAWTPANAYQGTFSTAGSDPTANIPLNDDSDSNFWVDVLIGPASSSAGPPLLPVPRARVAVQAGYAGRTGAGHSL